jgi:hypothetical protein
MLLTKTLCYELNLYAQTYVCTTYIYTRYVGQQIEHPEDSVPDIYYI